MSIFATVGQLGTALIGRIGAGKRSQVELDLLKKQMAEEQAKEQAQGEQKKGQTNLILYIVGGIAGLFALTRLFPTKK